MTRARIYCERRFPGPARPRGDRAATCRGPRQRSAALRGSSQSRERPQHATRGRVVGPSGWTARDRIREIRRHNRDRAAGSRLMQAVQALPLPLMHLDPGYLAASSHLKQDRGAVMQVGWNEGRRSPKTSTSLLGKTGTIPVCILQSLEIENKVECSYFPRPDGHFEYEDQAIDDC